MLESLGSNSEGPLGSSLDTHACLELALPFDDGRPFRASREGPGGGGDRAAGGGKGGKGKKGKGRGLRNVPEGFKGGGGTCRTCEGTHPETDKCPKDHAKTVGFAVDGDPDKLHPRI